MMRYRLGFLGILCLLMTSCRKDLQTSSSNSVVAKEVIKEKKVEFRWNQLIAKNIQENLTQADELLLIYSLVAIEKDQIVQIQPASHYVGKVKQGSVLELQKIPTLLMALKPGQSLGIQVSLWEVDDYQQVQQVLRQVNQWGGVLQVPISMMEFSSITNPFGWFMWGLRASGLAVELLNKWDGNDRLGISEMQISWEKLESFQKKGSWKSGPKMLNDYHYDFSYQIQVRD
ncbi:hypothetical protein [Aquirufa rosea]|uniref:Uncharacterized protein n=1 Tax=Aquirufa rosea TaxID=2509241 RepID=A0A4Q1BXY7_9BACT|nr:hypothetical protein [Aquirufa rosea]RXK47574.1 hypothetical protein ESB04_10055 [Aquirufa rosea]